MTHTADKPSPQRLSDRQAARVRTVSFKTPRGVPGAVTGIPDFDGDFEPGVLDHPVELRMTSAGMVWDRYTIPAGFTITKVQLAAAGYTEGPTVAEL